MNREEALLKFPKKRKVLELYKDHDAYFVVNDHDPDLHPIRVDLPEPPSWDKIEGFGLHPRLQKFKFEKYPEKLSNLEESVHRDFDRKSNESMTFRKTPQVVNEEIWMRLRKNTIFYKDEIKWIKQQWFHRLNGKWYFINGKPTFIDGWHFMFLNYFKMDTPSGHPDYRDRDRRWFNFMRYAYQTTKDIYGNEYNQRVCLGVNYPKHRRDGATYKTLCIGYCIVTEGVNRNGGIQSYDGDNAKEHFQGKLVNAFREMKFFFKPLYDGSDNPKNEINFKPPSSMYGSKYIGGNFDYAKTASRGYYDGQKLYFYDGEEVGKTLTENVRERHSVVKECLTLGGNAFVGFAIYPSTVGEMQEKGGKNFYELCNLSNAQEADPDILGQTKSGLWNLFIPAYDGLEGFIDEFGMSVIDKPTPSQAKALQKKIGARQFIENKRKRLLEDGDTQAYDEFIELFPIRFSDCFRTKDGNVGFDKQRLEEAQIRLRRDKSATVTGNFEWYGGIKDGNVVFIPNAFGKFKLSKQLPSSESSLKFKDHNGVFYPHHPDRFTASADPFKFITDSDMKKLIGKGGKSMHKLSKGGGSVFWNRDMSIDTEDKNVEEWTSHRFVCTYLNRTDDQDEYAEDMLMMCVYFGAMMYPETNVDLIYKHFIKRGYYGFLKYDIDEETGRVSAKPGFYSQGPIKQKLFNQMRDYIRWHIHREKHLEIVEECIAIKGIEYMTFYDLFTSCSGALLGNKSTYADLLNENKDIVDITDFYETYEY